MPSSPSPVLLTAVIALGTQACAPGATPAEPMVGSSVASEDGRWTARLEGMSFDLDAHGLRAQRGQDELGIRLSGWGRADALEVLHPVEPLAVGCSDHDLTAGCTLELRHPGLSESWRVVERGIEQAWEIPEPPPGEGLLALALELSGATHWQIMVGGRGALLSGSTGARWSYTGLQAWDADGQALDAWMEPSGEGLMILVDAADASWPVYVDPTLSEDIQLIGSDTDGGDDYGTSAAGVGDVNGDGYDDVVIGAYDADSGSASRAGAAYVYLGSASGIDLASELKLEASDAATADNFGFSVDGGGDVNGDGYDDVVIGAYMDDDLGSAAGAAYVYLGSASGIDTSTEHKLTASDGVAGDYYGYSVAIAGDLDGDGYDDVIVGAPETDGSGTDRGSAYVYFGSSSGIDAASELELVASDAADSDDYGYAVAGAGDLDGDGYHDVLVGAPRDSEAASWCGSVYVYLGSASGIDSSSEFLITPATGYSNMAFGDAVSAAGDVNGDGLDDIVVGSPYDGPMGWYSGSAFVYLGSTSGVDLSSEQRLYPSDGDEYEFYGAAVAAAGDVDTDGFDDIIIGALYSEAVAASGGAAYVYAGSASGIDASTETLIAPSSLAASDAFGSGVDGAGDVDGDGIDDVVVGARSANVAGGSSGAAWIFTGVCTAVWYLDDDGDGYGDPSSSTVACTAPSGYVGNADDCDDAEALAWTGAEELCDGADNDCDGTVDNDDAVDATTWYPDGDGDGYGDGASSIASCSSPSGYVDNADDCDDAEALAWTGATEVCDGADNDCDGTADNDDSVDAATWYIDFDGDGYGSTRYTEVSCTQPSGYVDNADDCDDAEALAWSGATEVCDGVDNDCDGTVDNDDAVDASTWYADADGDGYGDPASTTTACTVPSGYVDNTDDCDDAEPLAWTAAAESCDGVDNDCDGTVDNDDAVDASTWYADSDGDGFTDEQSSTTACDEPSGYAAASDEPDCDDGDAAVYPGAEEIADDGVDQDCDGADLEGTGDDTGAPQDDSGEPDDDTGADPKDEDGSCGGCATNGESAPGWFGLALLMGVATRRRR